jgi:hypothetical protein
MGGTVMRFLATVLFAFMAIDAALFAAIFCVLVMP